MRSANVTSCDLQRFCKEVLVAKQVKNDNVLAIKGVQMIDGLKPCIVSEWMEHGDMHAYLRFGGKDVADHVELVSPSLINGTCPDSFRYSCLA